MALCPNTIIIMKQILIETHIQSLEWAELSPEQQQLVTIAKEQTQRSYCPYSHYHVGAHCNCVVVRLSVVVTRKMLRIPVACARSVVPCLLPELLIRTNR